MIPFSKHLWRHVIAGFVLVCFDLLTVTCLLINPKWKNNVGELLFYITYLICTTIFVFTTFTIVLKKALNGTFGYDETQNLIRKFQMFGILSFGFLILLLIVMSCAFNGALVHWESFALTTFINMLSCLLMSRTYSFEHKEIRKYLNAAILANSHNGLTISAEEASWCCQLDVELTKIQSILLPEHLSSTANAICNVQYYFMMRWLHKLQLLMTANERERLWRTSELYNEIKNQASNLQIDESKAELWKKLASQLAIIFPFNKNLDFVYRNRDFDELESVD